MDLEKISFIIPLEPVGKMAPRRGKIMKTKTGRLFAPVHKDPKQAAREHRLEYYVEKYAPAVPWAGPIFLSVIVYFKAPKWPVWKMGIADKVWPTLTPDLDNCVKMIKDVMSGIIYMDDKQVCSGFSLKQFSNIARWEIELEQLSGYRHDVKRRDVA